MRRHVLTHPHLTLVLPQVLELHKCLFVYGTNRWLVHWVCLVGSLLGTLLPKPRREKKEKGGHSHPKTE